jgi:hypothetical protein
MCEHSLVDKLDKNIRSKLERYAVEYNSLTEHSQGRRSVEDRVFSYINELPKEHLRMNYIRYYYEERNKKQNTEITDKGYGHGV